MLADGLFLFEELNVTGQVHVGKRNRWRSLGRSPELVARLVVLAGEVGAMV